METMNAWFGLKEGHEDYSIENDENANLFFARSELDDQLGGILRKSFRTGTPPKLVLYGDWGVGKTHTMRHMIYKIEHDEDAPATVVFVELPDINSKSTFQVAHGALLDALGQDKAKEWVSKFQAQHALDMEEQIREFTQSGDIARAFTSLVLPGEGGRIAWDWLRGLPITAADAKLVGLTQVLTQSSHFVHTLRMFGRLADEVDKQLLVFMLDEVTKLGDVTNADAVNHWTNSLKVLADSQTKELGLIISGAWIETEDMALPLQDQQVETRFGESHYIPLRNLDESETAEFMADLLEQWPDPERRKDKIKEFDAERDGEPIVDRTYPFTDVGFEKVAAYAARNGSISTPRDIQQTLNDILNRAMDDGKHLVSGAYVTSFTEG